MAGWDKGGHGISQQDHPGSYTDCMRPSNLEKDHKGAAVACLSSIAKAVSQVSQVHWYILNVHCFNYVTNDEICFHSEQPALSNTICSRRLFFFGHLSRADPWQDHHRASRLAFLDLLETGDGGLAGPHNPGLEPWKTTCDHWTLGLATAKRRAQDRSAWRLLVTMATSMTSSWMMIDE